MNNAMWAGYQIDDDLSRQLYVINIFTKYMRPSRPYKTIFIDQYNDLARLRRHLQSPIIIITPVQVLGNAL